MNIAYDGHIFRWSRAGGIRRYFEEIISRLPQDWVPTIFGIENNCENLPIHARMKVSPLSCVRPRRFTQPIKKEWWRCRYLSRASVLHPTYYNLTGGLSYSQTRTPVVVTVHDFIMAAYPHVEADWGPTVRNQQEAILHATEIICVSESTRRDLLQRFPKLETRCTVIYHGSSFPLCDSPPREEIFETPTFLFVGGRETYKNFLFLLRAFAKACKSHPGIRLHVAGRALNDEEKWQIHLLGISDRIDCTVTPNDARLRSLYRNSVGLLYPSQFEGFGIPPLEAMACGVLAITSNVTSLPEVVGDAGIMLDPSDELAWVECILAVVNRKIDRNIFFERGRKRVQEFSWDRSARKHIEIYRRMAD